jgi:hypothetical protein
LLLLLLLLLRPTTAATITITTLHELVQLEIDIYIVRGTAIPTAPVPMSMPARTGARTTRTTTTSSPILIIIILLLLLLLLFIVIVVVALLRRSVHRGRLGSSAVLPATAIQ